MAGKRVLVIGGNFGGLTAALELKYELGEDVEVTVVSASDRFLFNPSLIWLPFGKRNAADITFALGSPSTLTRSSSCTPRRQPSTRPPAR